MVAFLSTLFTLEIFALTWCMMFYWTDGKISTGELVQLFYTIFNLALVVWVVSSQAPEFFRSLGIAKQALSII
jgi:ATP-binding cassette subfamily B protein